MLSDFKKFLFRGNVIDLAVAVIIGAAFTASSTAIIDRVITPLVGHDRLEGLHEDDLRDQRQHLQLRHRDRRRDPVRVDRRGGLLRDREAHAGPWPRAGPRATRRRGHSAPSDEAAPAHGDPRPACPANAPDPSARLSSPVRRRSVGSRRSTAGGAHVARRRRRMRSGRFRPGRASWRSSGHTVAVDRQAGEGLPAPARGLLRAAPIQGVGFDRDHLREAGIEEAGALAAVTSGDNSNIMVARTAREVFGVERVIARIYDPRRAAIYEKLGIPTIATVQWTTDRVLRRILPDAPATEWTDPSAERGARRAARRPELGRPPARRPRRRRVWPGWPPCPASAWGRSPPPTSSPRRATSCT